MTHTNSRFRSTLPGVKSHQAHVPQGLGFLPHILNMSYMSSDSAFCCLIVLCTWFWDLGIVVLCCDPKQSALDSCEETWTPIPGRTSVYCGRSLNLRFPDSVFFRFRRSAVSRIRGFQNLRFPVTESACMVSASAFSRFPNLQLPVTCFPGF